MTTKIMGYDLDEDLLKLVQDLIQFKGSYPSLYDRLMNLNTDTFTDEVQKVIDDLIDGYQNGGILTIQRIKKLENKSEASEKPKYEKFSYDTEQDIQSVIVYDKADIATQLKKSETTYMYDVINGSKEIVKSIVKIYDTDGMIIKETITKDYKYDANNNVISIQTSV